MNTAVFPPPPLSTNRLSLSLSTSTILGACCPPPACRAATTNDSAPTPTSTPRTMLLFIVNLLLSSSADGLYTLDTAGIGGLPSLAKEGSSSIPAVSSVCMCQLLLWDTPFMWTRDQLAASVSCSIG